MARRSFLSGLVIVVSFCLSNVTATPITLMVYSDSLGHAIPLDFVGLSFEASHIGDTIQFSISDSSMSMLLRQIGPGVIRIGGNSVDKDATPFDSIRYDRFFAFVKKTGWKLMQGLTLGTFDTVKAVQVAQLAIASILTNLYSFEVGNEPDLFSENGLRPATWDLSDYEKEFEEYETAIHSSLPKAPFSGPTTASSTTTWAVPFAAQEASNIMLLTQHYYAEGPAGDTTVTIGKLLSRATRASLLKTMALVHNAAQGASVPARISECNSVYDGGQKGVSDVFASSLWAADIMFSLADAGISGVNFHGGGTGNYTPLAVSSSGAVSVRPEYYGIMLFRYAAWGSFVRSKVSDTVANIGIYPMLCGNDSMRVVFINKDSLTSYEVTVTGIPFNGPASIVRLNAPSLHSTSGILLGGDSIGVILPWAPTNYEAVPDSQNGFLVSIPAASAGVLTVKRQSNGTKYGVSLQQPPPIQVRVIKGSLCLQAPAGERVGILLYGINGRILARKELRSNGSQMQIPLLTKLMGGVGMLAIRIGNATVAKLVLPDLF